MSIIVKNLSYTHPNKDILFQNLHFTLSKGQKVALIGNNGTGKSILLNILAGNLKNKEGEIILSHQPYLVPQHVGQYDTYTISQVLGIEKKLTALKNILNGDLEIINYTLLEDDWDIEEKSKAALAAWGLEHISLDQPLYNLSGGEKTKVFLAGLSIHFPKIILMDEPTNHLDKKSRSQLYDLIRKSNATIFVVSHDRVLLNEFSTIYELKKDKIAIYGGNYEFYKEQKSGQLNALKAQVEEKEKQLRQAKKTAQETLDRQNKHSGRGRKANIKKGIPKIALNSLKDHSEKSTSKLKGIHSDKLTEIKNGIKEIQKKIPESKNIKVDFEASDLHYNKVLINANAINFSYGKSYLWKNKLSFQIKSGERIRITGKNGSGKTTLIKLMLGELQPSVGKLHLADFNFLYIDQEYSLIEDKLTVLEQVEKFNNRHLEEHELKKYLHRFLFPAETWDKTCGILSGGEKMKLILCCLQVSNNIPDCFALDEPTNNLDIENIEIITSFVQSFHGTVFIISHDDYFIQDLKIQKDLNLD